MDSKRKNKKRILIISTNAIGDTYLSSSILSIPELSSENNCYTIVTTREAKFLTEKLNYRSTKYINNRNYLSIFLAVIYLLLRKYEIAFSFFGGRVNSILLLFARAKIKSGFINIKKIEDWSIKKAKLYLKGLPLKNDYIWNPEMNFMDRIKLCLKPLEIDTDNLKKIKFQTYEYIPTNEDKSILINYDSKVQEKRLDVKILEELIEYLTGYENYKIKIIDFNKRFKIKKNNVIIYNIFDMDDILNLLNECTLFITTDSFILHLADAYNIKTLGIFFKTKPESAFYSFKDKHWLSLRNNYPSNAKIIYEKVLSILSNNENHK